MLTPPYTPVTSCSSTSDGAGDGNANSNGNDRLTSSIQLKPQSIFDAVTLVAYNIPIDRPDGALDSITRLIKAAKQQDTSIKYDFQYHHDPYTPNRHDSRVVRIFLPEEVHQADHDAWIQVNRLKELLIEMNGASGMEVEWSACGNNDRAQSCSYQIWGNTDDPRFKNDSKRFRLQIINQALKQAGVQTSSHIWQEHGQSGAEDQYHYGHVQLASPGEVEKAIAASLASSTISTTVIIDPTSKFDVNFLSINFHIRPSTCKMLAAEIRSDIYAISKSSYEPEVQNLARWVGHSIQGASFEFHNLPDNPDRWLYVEASSPMVARAMCERPFMDGTHEVFFRLVFFINGNPFNFKQGGCKNYRLARLKAYDKRRSDGFDCPSESTLEFVVDHRSIRGHDDPISNASQKIAGWEKDVRKKKRVLGIRMNRWGFRPDDDWIRMAQEVRVLEGWIKDEKLVLEGLRTEENKVNDALEEARQRRFDEEKLERDAKKPQRAARKLLGSGSTFSLSKPATEPISTELDDVSETPVTGVPIVGRSKSVYERIVAPRLAAEAQALALAQSPGVKKPADIDAAGDTDMSKKGENRQRDVIDLSLDTDPSDSEMKLSVLSEHIEKKQKVVTAPSLVSNIHSNSTVSGVTLLVGPSSDKAALPVHATPRFGEPGFRIPRKKVIKSDTPE